MYSSGPYDVLVEDWRITIKKGSVAVWYYGDENSRYLEARDLNELWRLSSLVPGPSDVEH